MANRSVAKQLDFAKVTKIVEEAVKEKGWKKSSAGESTKIDYNKRVDLYIRIQKLAEVMRDNDGFFKKESLMNQITDAGKPYKLSVCEGFSGMVSDNTMGSPKEDLTPSSLQPILCGGENLPVLSDFMNYPSLAALRKNSPSLVIAFDSEWYYIHDKGLKRRIILTWQFALICGEYLCEYIFVRKTFKYGLSFEIAIGRILDSLALNSVDIRSVRKYEVITGVNSATGNPKTEFFDSRNVALKKSVQPFPDNRDVHITYDWSQNNSIPVTLLCHAGKCDVSGLDQSKKNSLDIMRFCNEVQGGLVSMYPIKTSVQSVDPMLAKSNNIRAYPISLQLADTMCHAPSGMNSLEDLGKVVGRNKIKLDDGVIEHMDQLLLNNPCTYFEYASNDSVVTLLYESALYGYNNKPPLTITSASANVMRDVMKNYLGCENNKQFIERYRGVKDISHGLVPKNTGAGYIESTSLEAISDEALTIQRYAIQAYHGGYNGSSDIGYFPKTTFDYDLRNAYPTAMCLVSDVDWENPIRTEISKRELTLQDFVVPIVGGYAPISMMLAYVRFEFPKDVGFPCIPVCVDGIPIYPLTSEGLKGVYACGPELFLALQLGAKIYAEKAYILNSIIKPETGEISYSLRSATKQVVADRAKAKEIHGNKSLEDLILKTMGVIGYGKISQNVIQKSSWSAYEDEMKELGCSAITNPFAACMTTSIVRAELLAVQNQCLNLGYTTYSVTTDGFISDIPENVLKSLDLFGLKPFMEKARLFLTDGKDEGIWEIKHCQDDLVNITTRGNVSQYCKTNPFIYDGKSYEGVCAHNSAKSGAIPDSYEDRLWLRKEVLKRTGTVDYQLNELTSFKELVRGEEFREKTITKHIRMDFDMKRKPDRDSFYKMMVPVEGVAYEVANFTTVPFTNIAEFREYRQRKASVKCLRTMENWLLFWFKGDKKGCKTKRLDKDWSILYSCISGHRAGFWNIPKLDSLQGTERDEWINSHNTSSKIWKSSDWKNAGRRSRQDKILNKEMIEEKLIELMNDL